MALEQVYLWFLISRLTGIAVLNLLGQMVRSFLLAGLMYSLIMLLKSILPLTNIPLFFFYVLFGIAVYGVGIFVFDKDLLSEIRSLKAVKQHSSVDEE